MEIHQFHSGSSSNDAITNQMLSIRQILRGEGYISEIFVEHIDPLLSTELRLFSQYQSNPENILLVHHSMGFDLFNEIVSLPERKILIYHNITPEKFFSNPLIIEYIKLGRKQLAEYRPYIDYALADSIYNQQELFDNGFKQVSVMPVTANLDKFMSHPVDSSVVHNYRHDMNILFVGRLVPNKCQEDVIRIFAYYRHHYKQAARLFLVGDTTLCPDYVIGLKILCSQLAVSDTVVFTGKVPDEKLKAYYHVASIFLCMSEHEGFGVPLLEAMAMGVPVIAYNSSAIPEIVSGAGIIAHTKDAGLVSEMIDIIETNIRFKEELIDAQRQQVEALRALNTRDILLAAINHVTNQGTPLTTQIQGSFETSYSLAIVNRKLAEALAAIPSLDVSIYATEGLGDYLPNPSDLTDKQVASQLWQKSKLVASPDVVIRDMYPPRVADSPGKFNFLYFGWEETKVPKKYISDFNQYLTGIGAMSHFVKQALVASGATVPITVTGVGVWLPANFADIEPFSLKTMKKFRFMHISSALPRKGIDILLRAYFSAFNGNDDVTLVIKTFPNPHNNVEQQLNELIISKDNPPEVILINKDLPQEQIYALYKTASCYVHAARGEGFGLPVAEAMLAGVPVIVSANTGLADFCTDSTAILIGCQTVSAHSHLSETGSLWAEPDAGELAEKMRQIIYSPDSMNIPQRVEEAHKLISTEFTWQKVAARWYQFIKKTVN